MSVGMAKVYRMETFIEIGGLVEEIMWDGIDCHQARTYGWKSRSFDSVATDFKHLRPEGSSDRGVLRGRRRHGYGQWFMGSDPLFVVCSAILRIRDSPVILGSFHILMGFLSAAFRRVERYGDQSFRTELRRFQRESLLFGKRRATRRWEARTAAVWTLRHPQ
jgi:biofilm PGA synthesis N-glycosyltransferase PgaC